MSEISITQYGAKISITNNSNIILVSENNEGYIINNIIDEDKGYLSPTLLPTNTVKTIIPNFVIKVPSFVTYRYTTIAPGDTVSFVVYSNDEILYYQSLMQNNIQGVSVKVEELTNKSVQSSDVNFYDYTGDIVNSYTKEEFLKLTKMPPNPVHEGLVAQGWNWDFEDATEFVSNYGKLDVGQSYITDNGATRIYISLYEGKTSPYLCLCPNGTLIIDWGDGSPTEEMTGTSVTTVVSLQHQYSKADDYIISIMPTENSTFCFKYAETDVNCGLLRSNLTDDYGRRRLYLQAIKAIHIGVGMDTLSLYCLDSCTSLHYLTTPISLVTLFPQALVSVPVEVMVIPNGVTEIQQNAFRSSIRKLIWPRSITTIGVSALAYNSLTSFIFPDKITNLPNSAVENTSSLLNILLPDSITSFGGSVFSNCQVLLTLTLPKYLETMGRNCISRCTNLVSLEFKSKVPPTVGSDCFNSLPTDCTIYIPKGTYNTYTTTSNYPNPNVYTYIEREE